jgi:hypothetical protein
MNDDQVVVGEAMLEDLIRKVRGVLAVRVVQNGQNQIDEIHAVGSPARSAKQMVRDIESILFVRGGIRLDHRKISLVQIADTGMPGTMVRVQLLEVADLADLQPPAMSATIAVGDRRIQGIGRVRANQDVSAEWLVAQATANALDQLIGVRGQLHVENLQRQSFGALQIYLAHLTLAIDDGIETYLGVSVVREDESSAVARAVLDAVNRRLQRLLGESNSASGR